MNGPSCAWCKALMAHVGTEFPEADVSFFHVLYCGAPEDEWADLEELGYQLE